MTIEGMNPTTYFFENVLKKNNIPYEKISIVISPQIKLLRNEHIDNYLHSGQVFTFTKTTTGKLKFFGKTKLGMDFHYGSSVLEYKDLKYEGAISAGYESKWLERRNGDKDECVETHQSIFLLSLTEDQNIIIENYYAERRALVKKQSDNLKIGCLLVVVLIILILYFSC